MPFLVSDGKLGSDDGQGAGENGTEKPVRNPGGEMAPDRDAGQAADQERGEQAPIDRTHQPVAEPRDESQRHAVRDVGPDEPHRR